jgi:hypothetical protein
VTKSIEVAARAMCKSRGTGQCAALCLSHSSNFTTSGKCPEAITIWKREATAVLETTLEPTEEEVEAVHHEVFRRSGKILDRADVEAALRAAALVRLGRTEC